jgi:hypothetical protein
MNESIYCTLHNYIWTKCNVCDICTQTAYSLHKWRTFAHTTITGSFSQHFRFLHVSGVSAQEAELTNSLIVTYEYSTFWVWENNHISALYFWYTAIKEDLIYCPWQLLPLRREHTPGLSGCGAHQVRPHRYREDLMIYRWPGFVAVAWFGTTPTSFPGQRGVSLSSCVSAVELTDERGGSGRGDQSYDSMALYKSFNTLWRKVSAMDQITIKTPNPEGRLDWCLIEFTDWKYSQSCWYFWPILWTSAPLTFVHPTCPRNGSARSKTITYGPYKSQVHK